MYIKDNAMRTLGFGRVLSLVLVAALVFAVSVPIYAQDDMSVACDSTLVTLLLVAERDYGYLSSKMDLGEMTNIDLGQYDSLFSSIMSAMMTDEMSEEEMTSDDAMNARVEEMRMMGSAEMLADYAEMTGMANESMTVLEPGVVSGENELCTTLRADVEQFILAHILADMEMMDDM
jgi:hypothetical protein